MSYALDYVNHRTKKKHSIRLIDCVLFCFLVGALLFSSPESCPSVLHWNATVGVNENRPTLCFFFFLLGKEDLSNNNTLTFNNNISSHETLLSAVNSGYRVLIKCDMQIINKNTRAIQINK